MHSTVRTLGLGAALSTLLLAGCPTGGSSGAGGGGGGSGTGTIPEPDNTVKVSLADVGLEASSLDQTADPCDDFYQFACGGWMAQHEIPADRARWGRFGEIDERNETTLHAVVEDAAAAAAQPEADPSSDIGKIGNFYSSCMDEATIEKTGLAGIAPLRSAITKVKDVKTLQAALVTLHNAGVDVVFGTQTEADFKDSSMNVLWADGSGLGLPDRDYYFEEAFKDKLEAYHQHLVRLFGLLGKTTKGAAETAAQNVLSIESKLAKVTKTSVEKRDLPKLYNPYDLAGLGKLTPKLDWPRYLAGRGNADVKTIIIATPAFFTELNTLLGSVKATQWQDYLLVHLVDTFSFALPKKFDDEAFALQQALSGVEAQRERYKRCIDAVGVGLTELLNGPYIERVFPGESKAAAVALVKAIADSFAANLSSLPWMSATTKKAAQGKLSKLEALIGYPDVPKTYDFDVKPGAFAGNLIAATTFNTRRGFIKAGKPYDRSEWLMPAYIVNAYYNPLANNTGLPAGILQPPFFGKDRSVAANEGGIGMVIGHELTHGFDDQGAQFNATGNMEMWWQEADYAKFTAKGECLAEQYSTFEVLPGKNVNGKLTLGENIADLGGIKLAFHAYRTLRKDAEDRTLAEGFTEDQQFFLGVGQAWCSKDRDAEAESRLTTDPHSPPRWRVNGSLRNTPEFAQAFACEAGTPMAPTDRCEVW